MGATAMKTSKVWRPRAASSHLFVMFYITVLLLFSDLQLSHSTRSMSSKNSRLESEAMPSTMEDVESDFLSWIASVGAKSKSSSLAPITRLPSSVKAVPQVYYVDVAGFGNFKTVQEAVNAVPDGNSMQVLIIVKPGTYRERVTIPKSKGYITLQGAGKNVTFIEYDMNAATAGSTYDSATVAVFSDYFVAKDISFKNSAPAPPAGAVNMQAVALRITGDCAAFYNCGFYGSQDTLNDDMGRHYYKNCEIVGSIDFIFGDAQSLYKDCTLNVNAATYGSVTAQKRESSNKNTGFSFVGCNLLGSGQVYLGRAWGPYSRVVFAFTFMQDIVIREGWHNWNVPDRQRTAYYGQYKCSGPGATELGRVAWSHELTDAEAAPFLTLSFIDGQNWVTEP
ncbi:hypothetical protein M758_9G143200 [Ceratodon purpureus]|uniref:Pectinesterase n=1 Tax=Ceratodon purpureus TaxID=3225 RepID=A0A8T0GU84_CERPU|nr:hypothetical protein KC19_9G149600 [Ceratodon purpureus]KAG0606472.1 hypothetical protein M758_9G143200 [Ceratodon purpureus]